MTNIYRREPTSAHSQFNAIAAAYRTAELDPPTRAIDIKNLVNNNGRNVYQVAAELAQEALTTAQEPEEWYAAAVDAIKDAQAREALTAAFNRSYDDAVTRALPQYLTDAINDLTPTAEKAIKQLTAAANKLPAGAAALDPEANIANDTGQALQDARTALATLGKLASVFQAGRPGDITPALAELLPIVDLPEATVERIARTFAASPIPTNTEELGSTHQIRALSEAAGVSADLAIINIARGDYDGITLRLATPAEHKERRANATKAFQRLTVDAHTNALVS